jgi:hypothetical protein
MPANAFYTLDSAERDYENPKTWWDVDPVSKFNEQVLAATPKLERFLRVLGPGRDYPLCHEGPRH